MDGPENYKTPELLADLALKVSVYWLQSDDDVLLLIIDTDTTLRCGITCTS